MEGSLLHCSLRSIPCCIPPIPARARWPRSLRGSTRVTPLPKVRVRCGYLESINDEIEAHLEKAILIRPPLAVFEPMRSLTFSAPRSMAPALCVAACELVGGNRDRAIPTAAALHMMLAASYFHEHLPLSDGPMSRLEPAIHHEFRPNIELLIADGMVPFGLELIARSDGPASENPDLTLRVILEITRAIGSQGIIHGQYIGAKRARSGHDECDANWVESVREKKWGELYGCAGACGAILGGGSETEIGKLRKYGLYVGISKGMLNEAQRRCGHDLKVVEEVKKKAFHELEEINWGNVGPIMSLLGDYDNTVVTYS